MKMKSMLVTCGNFFFFGGGKKICLRSRETLLCISLCLVISEKNREDKKRNKKRGFGNELNRSLRCCCCCSSFIHWKCHKIKIIIKNAGQRFCTLSIEHRRCQEKMIIVKESSDAVTHRLCKALFY